MLCLCLVFLNILQYTRYEPITCQNIQLSNNLRGEIKELEVPQQNYQELSNEILNFSEGSQEESNELSVWLIKFYIWSFIVVKQSIKKQQNCFAVNI